MHDNLKFSLEIFYLFLFAAGGTTCLRPQHVKDCLSDKLGQDALNLKSALTAFVNLLLIRNGSRQNKTPNCWRQFECFQQAQRRPAPYCCGRHTVPSCWQMCSQYCQFEVQILLRSPSSWVRHPGRSGSCSPCCSGVH